jgi:hypothetical protein
MFGMCRNLYPGVPPGLNVFINGESGLATLLINTIAHQEGPSIEDKMRPPELDEVEGDGDEDRDGMYSRVQR